MKISLAATLFAVASMPILGQMPATPAPEQPGNPPMQQSTLPGEARPGAKPSTPASQPETPAALPSAPDSTSPAKANATPMDMRPVDSKLISKLDSKTAKTGDDVVLQTESEVKTADGTDLPKGTKVMGKVVAVHPSGGQTAQLVLLFDHAELKDGKTMPIHSEIESVGSGMTDMVAANAPQAASTGTTTGTAATGAANSNASDPSTATSGATTGMPASRAGAATAGARPAAGTIISRNGNIAIRTTSIPGVMLANNAPGQHDPRMAQASGLLLGASRDVELDSGTRFVLAVAPSSPAAAAPAAPQP